MINKCLNQHIILFLRIYNRRWVNIGNNNNRANNWILYWCYSINANETLAHAWLKKICGADLENKKILIVSSDNINNFKISVMRVFDSSIRFKLMWIKPLLFSTGNFPHFKLSLLQNPDNGGNLISRSIWRRESYCQCLLLLICIIYFSFNWSK